MAENACAPMPRYRCHKEVWALKIARIECHPSGHATITPAEAGYAPFEVPKGYVMKHSPYEGGYYVVYEDGYKSFSPPGPFEAGYTRIGA